MKKSDFNVKGKNVKILVENARKIVEQEGSCESVHCSYCPFNISNLLINADCDYYRKYKSQCWIKDPLMTENAKQFISLFNIISTQNPQYRIKELERQIKRQETNIKGYKDEIKHCREILKQEERKCVTEKVELNVKLHLDGEIFTGVVVQN